MQIILIKSRKYFKLRYILLKNNITNSANIYKKYIIKIKKLFKTIFFDILKNFLVEFKICNIKTKFKFKNTK